MKELKLVSFLILSAFLVNCSSGDSEPEPNSNPTPEIPDPPAVDPSPVQVSTFFNINAADALTLDDNGNLFATNYGTDIVYRITPDRNISTFASNQLGAAGMDFDSEGFLYLARYDVADIAKISPDGSEITQFAAAVPGPIAVEFDSQGNLFVNNNVNSAYTKIDPDGNKTRVTISSVNNSSLTLDDDDNIYISDYTTGIIHKVDAETGDQTVFANLPVTGGVGYITYSNDYFFATSLTDHQIFMIDMNGSVEVIAGQRGVTGTRNGSGDVATFHNPIGIVASSDGNTLFVAQNGGSGAIRMITGFRTD